ncbi:MAG: cell wall metabolism sensor histidine kinase WalK [bacterium]|nr:cell wall metabolism sensor histidine kinase WalK [bacterium]
MPLTALRERLAQLRGAVILGAVVASAWALMLGFVLARRVTRPLLAMATAAEQIAEDAYGQKVPVPSRDELGTLARAFNTMSEKLRDSVATVKADRGKLTAILSSMVEGVVAVDRDERVVHLNQGAAQLLEVKPADALGRPIWEVTRLREVPETLAEALRREQVVHRVVRLPGAPDRFFDLQASPLRTGGDLPSGAVLVLSDLTELRRLETIRRDFVSNVSHELKTPVTAIRGLVETLVEDPEIEAATRQRFLGKIHNQAERLSNLVTDLVSLSRLEAEEAQPELGTIDVLEPVLQSVRGLQPVSEARGLRIETELADAPLLVKGEEESLERAVTNLLDNAIKYSPEGGRIAVRAQAREGVALIEVEDEGPGIEPRHQERIFERFYRVDAARSRALGGTGLGLAIVKHTALALGGDVSLDSTPGEGSTFRIRLPLVAAGKAADEGEQESAIPLPEFLRRD